MVRALMDGNKKADDGITGWENRAELALILKADDDATKCIKGLIEMEAFRAYLVGKNKDLEIIALDKLMSGDKAACAVVRKLTPSAGEKLAGLWKSQTRFGKIKITVVASGVAMLALSWLFQKSGLEDSVLGGAVRVVFDIVLLVVTLILGVIAGIWLIMKGAPYRDKVQGPNAEGVDFLRKLCETGVDENEKERAMGALQTMLMGQEPNVEGKTFLRNKASKYAEKMPKATEALDTMDYVYTLQQAGKSVADARGFDVQVEWPALSELWPPTKFKVLEAKAQVTTKLKAFFFTASIHPWMKKYAQCADDAAVLFQAVEVPLTMKPDNTEEFDALDKLYKGYRPDPAGLKPLQDMIDKLVGLDKNGYAATSLSEALTQHHRTGDVKTVFKALDTDESGALDYDECEKAAGILADKMNFHIDQDELDAAFKSMDLDGDGEVDFKEFSTWWKLTSLDKTQKRAKKLQQMEAAGMLETSPKPKELQALMKVLTLSLPTIAMRVRTFETLEDMCPDDETFDRLQECFNLCELKRMVLTDQVARNAVVGLEAICIVPQLLDGDEKLGISPNPKAKEILELVKKGDPAAMGALAYLRQKEWRRYWGMMTGRQRRAFMLICFIFGYPALIFLGVVEGVPDVDALAAMAANMIQITQNVTNSTNSSDSGSWEEDNTFAPVDEISVPSGNRTVEEYSNPSFYVLGILPAMSTTFVNFFGQRIASLITLMTVFFASAGATIAASLNDGDDEFTPNKLLGVGMGMYAGGVATKVATGNIKFAYGVQGASVGAVVSRLATFIWRPKLLWLIPELEPAMDWVDLAMAGLFGAAAAWISNTYRGLISIFATAAIGTMGTVQVLGAYSIPGMGKFTLARIMADGVSCGAGEDSCWMSGALVLSLLLGGTANQFKMQKIDFSLPAVTAYERVLHKIEKAMALLFALSDYIDGMSLETGDMMERCLQARDKLVSYANLVTNLMHFSLCFGFAADFILNVQAGVFSAVPWVGFASLALAIVTPIQGGIGVVSPHYLCLYILVYRN